MQQTTESGTVATNVWPAGDHVPLIRPFDFQARTHAVFTLIRHDNCPDMSHASYQIINVTNSHPVLRSQRYGIPRLLQHERIIKTITRILSALNAKSTIVSFAIACKTLERPVLDALWESQDDWFQLLKCFPPDVWEERDNAFVSCRSFAITYHLLIFTHFGIRF